MPIGTTAAIVGGGAALGLMGGLLDSGETTSGVRLGKAGELERQGYEGGINSLKDLNAMITSGASVGDYGTARSSQLDLATMLEQYSKGGFLPGQQDINKANELSGQLFASQRTQMQQSFQDQLREANRQAALSGRGVNDPILRAKLAQEQTRQSSMLDAQQGSYAIQMAMQMPGQRLGFMGQRADVLGNMAQQGIAARMNLFNAQQGALQNERNFRLQTATQYQNDGKSPLGRALSGAVGGAGMGMQAAGAINQMGAMNAMQGYYSAMTPQAAPMPSMTSSFSMPQMSWGGGGGNYSVFGNPAYAQQSYAPTYQGSNTNWMSRQTPPWAIGGY